VDDDRARGLLEAERQRVAALLDEAVASAQEDRATANDESGDTADPAERLTAEEVDDDVVETLRRRLEAIGRAEHRLEEGTYGRSVRSGVAIPDERLQADPAAELTVEEAQA
jgi:RNA polymerase-binding transcription factor